MFDHDQRFKLLLLEFIADFLHLFFRARFVAFSKMPGEIKASIPVGGLFGRVFVVGTSTAVLLPIRLESIIIKRNLERVDS